MTDPLPTLSAIASRLLDYNPDALPVSQAQHIMRQLILPLHAIEEVALRSALGRVLGADILSPIHVPAHDNAAMDGYAFRGEDLQAETACTLNVVGTSYAGRAFAGLLQSGECLRIMTGGVMPAGCDTVVPQELIRQLTDASIEIPAGSVKRGDNRRLKGEDLEAGKPALRKGKILTPADLGILASLGIAEIPLQRRLRVAFFSTGDELCSLGETLNKGCVYDSNRYTLHGMLTRLGCEMLDLGVVKDQAQALENALRTACENADAIITSGGASAGSADYTSKIMAQLGDVMFWKINMRPGRPMTFGKISSNGKQAYLFGLPGNPVAVMVTFYILAREALLHMMGAEPLPLPLMQVRAQGVIRKKPGRTEYPRGILSQDADGRCQVRLCEAQGSGILRSMSEANCMLVLPPAQADVQAGQMVDVVQFTGLI